MATGRLRLECLTALSGSVWAGSEQRNLSIIGHITHDHGVPFHTNAAQSVGKIPTRVDELEVDLLTVAGHKLYAPKGVGALYVRRGLQLEPHGHPTERLPNTLNVSFAGVDGNSLLAALPEVATSTGSACHSGETEPSAVLLAMGVPRDLALGAVRLSLGRWTTEAEVDRTVMLLAEQLKILREERSMSR